MAEAVLERPEDAKSVDILAEVVGESFAPVYRAEIESIKKRRDSVAVHPDAGPLALPDAPQHGTHRPSATLSQVFSELKDSNADWEDNVAQYDVPSGLIGVALSGGGIGSSTFNLGVLQAIARVGLFPYVDYLSTVSGGGYIGTYLTTSIIEDVESLDRNSDPQAKSKSSNEPDGDGPKDWFPFAHKTGEVENRRIRHLRNYAQFLAPGGKSELLSIPILLLRGLVINLLILLTFLLGAGMALGYLMTGSPNYQYLTHERLAPFLNTPADISAGGLGMMLGYFPFSLGILALLLVSFVLFPIFQSARRTRMLNESKMRWWRNTWLAVLRAALVTGLIVCFVELQPVMLANGGDIKQWLVGFLGAAAATLPFSDKIVSRLSEFQAKIGAALVALLAVVFLWLVLLYLTRQFADGQWDWWQGLVALAILAVFSVKFVDVNATSIHNYYRDRLVRAFVAQAAADDMLYSADHERADEESKEVGLSDNKENKAGKEEPVPKLSELNELCAPYQLINATINVERDEINYRSGRHGGFFFFSRHYCGGIRTGYLPTRDLESFARTLDVGAAMAISGAAVAPNMGKASNRFVGFILAILNIRLNYWLHNPKRIKPSKREGTDQHATRKLSFTERLFANDRVGPVYLLREMFQWLSARSKHVNLSDGGHIENLGIYELLRRQCRLIIAGDGECDGELSFQGLTEAIRLARIDFGYRIEMDGLDEIRSGDQQFAIGTIYYGELEVGGQTRRRIGKLIYIKSNLGGDYNLKSTLASDFYRSSADRDDDHLYDENSYVSYYKDKNPDFPHQSTADQFFDEAQFESYRALGYQVAATALIAPWVPDTETEDLR